MNFQYWLDSDKGPKELVTQGERHLLYSAWLSGETAGIAQAEQVMVGMAKAQEGLSQRIEKLCITNKRLVDALEEISFQSTSMPAVWSDIPSWKEHLGTKTLGECIGIAARALHPHEGKGGAALEGPDRSTKIG